MEHYNLSVVGACIINKLNLPDIALQLIRYYSNLSLDIVGYTKRDLIRFITDDNEEMMKIYQNKHRTQIIRLLYKLGKHIPPRRKQLNRFKLACENIISRYEMNNNYITMYNHENNVITDITVHSIFAVDVFSSKNQCVYQYQMNICRINPKKKKVTVSCIRCHLKYFQTREVSLVYDVRMNVWNLMFIYLHQNYHYHNFLHKNILSIPEYIKCLMKTNISKERSINSNLMNDSRKHGMEYITNSILNNNCSSYTYPSIDV